MKKIAVSTTILAAILLLASINSMAQTTRVKFKRGSNSATVSSKNGKVDFTQRAVHDTQF